MLDMEGIVRVSERELTVFAAAFGTFFHKESLDGRRCPFTHGKFWA